MVKDWNTERLFKWNFLFNPPKIRQKIKDLFCFCWFRGKSLLLRLIKFPRKVFKKNSRTFWINFCGIWKLCSLDLFQFSPQIIKRFYHVDHVNDNIKPIKFIQSQIFNHFFLIFHASLSMNCITLKPIKFLTTQ